MSSSQQSHKQIILKMAQATGEVSILGRTYYWFFPDKYAKRLFGDKCNKELLRKLKSRSSTRIMRVALVSTIISLYSLEVGLGLGALVTEDPRNYDLLLIGLLSISGALAIHARTFLSEFEYEEEPLDIEASLSSFTRIERISSRRFLCFAYLPITTCVLALGFHLMIEDPRA